MGPPILTHTGTQILSGPLQNTRIGAREPSHVEAPACGIRRKADLSHTRPVFPIVENLRNALTKKNKNKQAVGFLLGFFQSQFGLFCNIQMAAPEFNTHTHTEMVITAGE